MNRKNFSVFYCFILTLFLGCSADEHTDEIHQPILAQLTIQKNDGEFILDGRSSLNPDGRALTYKWSSSSALITIPKPTLAIANFFSPITSIPFDVTITLEISDGTQTNTASKIISIDQLTETEAYGLGKLATEEKSNEVNYEWYFDQANTGIYSMVNCGPTAVTMAVKWNDQNFVSTPANARERYVPQGGWWATNDVIRYLDDNLVHNETIRLNNIEQIEKEIEQGNIIILCLDMFYVSNQIKDRFRVNRFYEANAPNWGHFIVVKGYKKVDDQLFYECYDPYSLTLTYTDYTLKGKNRYYKASDLEQATNNWWDFAITISKKGITGRKNNPYAVDPATIIHKSGR